MFLFITFSLTKLTVLCLKILIKNEIVFAGILFQWAEYLIMSEEDPSFSVHFFCGLEKVLKVSGLEILCLQNEGINISSIKLKMLLSFDNIKLNEQCLLITYFGNSHSQSLYHEPQNSEYERLKEILKKKKNQSICISFLFH